MRTRILAPLLACAPLLGATALGGPVSHTDSTPAGVRSALHLALDHSSPAADEVVESPARISLWFTQAPQMSGTSVRIVPEGGRPLVLGSAKAAGDDPKLVVLDVDRPLADGAYTVNWRAMAQDGHTVRGDFGFTVKAGR